MRKIETTKLIEAISSTLSNDHRTDEEYCAQAMLLGMEYIPAILPDGSKSGLFRKRDAPSFSGCAYFSYYTLDLTPIIVSRSEIDGPWQDGVVLKFDVGN